MTFKKIGAVLLGVCAIVIALVIVDELEPQPVVVESTYKTLPPVSVMEVAPELFEAQLTLLATTAARWPVALKVSSSAELQWLNPDIEPGLLIKQGTKLAQLDTSVLDSHLAQANSALKRAELNLKQAQHEQTVALQMLSSGNRSPFARREPQVAAAKAQFEEAEQSYNSAVKLLREAEIRAPFDAIVLQRHVSPGEWLEAGQVVFELAASDSLDVTLPVSELHWQKVQAAISQLRLTVVNRDGSQWPAKVRYVAAQADPTTRQRQVVLSVENPYLSEPRLLSNQQVKVKVNLGVLPDVVTLPLSALTRDGFVWTLDSDNRLQKEWVSLVDQSGDNAFVRFAQQSHQPRTLVLYPLLSMLPGKQVQPEPMEMSSLTAEVKR